MKVTENTTIKDLITEGYGVSIAIVNNGDDSLDGRGASWRQRWEEMIKPEPDQRFLWYINRYLFILFDTSARWLRKGMDEYYHDLFVGEKYNEIPYEIRMGLLRYICLHEGLTEMTPHYYLINLYKGSPSEIEHLDAIIPRGLIKSLIDG